MNELIRKFERESHIDVYGLGKDRIKWEETLEKFAELIVRECVWIVDNEGTSDEIFEHFGVDQ